MRRRSQAASLLDEEVLQTLSKVRRLTESLVERLESEARRNDRYDPKVLHQVVAKLRSDLDVFGDVPPIVQLPPKKDVPKREVD